MKLKQHSKILVLTVIVLSSGCVSVWNGKECRPDPDAVYIRLDDLSKYNRNKNCGELAVNQIISYFKSSKKIDKTGLNFASFNDTVSLVRYARNNGLKCRMAKPELVQIINEVKNDRPVIVFVPVDSSRTGQYISENYATHSIVICGYQKNKKELLFYSNGAGPFKISSEKFVQEWNKTGKIAIMFGKINVR
ncbi:MAG: C39 family peptidase [Victivallaceae bacterium]